MVGTGREQLDDLPRARRLVWGDCLHGLPSFWASDSRELRRAMERQAEKRFFSVPLAPPALRVGAPERARPAVFEPDAAAEPRPCPSREAAEDSPSSSPSPPSTPGAASLGNRRLRSNAKKRAAAGSGGDEDDCWQDADWAHGVDSDGGVRGPSRRRRKSRKVRAIAVASLLESEGRGAEEPGGPEAGGAHGPGSARTPHGTLASLYCSLELRARPPSLPCRDAERAMIEDFLEAFVREAKGGGVPQSPMLYLYGLPGTGKTATVMEALRAVKLRLTGDADGPVSIRHLFVNSMMVGTPVHVFQSFLEQQTGGTVWAPAEARDEYRRRLRSRRGFWGDSATMTVAVVDEMDLLCTRRNEVLKELLSWPTERGARLAVVGIGNRADLPQCVWGVGSSTASKCRRVEFRPYSVEQLEQIARARIGDVPLFKRQAIELACRRVANTGGDARRLLDTLRQCVTQFQQMLTRAGGDVEEGSLREAISVATVASIIQESQQGSQKVQTLFAADFAEKVLLASLVLQHRKTGIRATTLETALDIAQSLGPFRSLCATTLLNAATRLHALGVVALDCGPCSLGRHARISLVPDMVEGGDVRIALQGDPELSWLATKLPEKN